MADGAVEGEAAAVEALRPLGGLTTVDTLNLEVNALVDGRLHLNVLEDLQAQKDSEKGKVLRNRITASACLEAHLLTNTFLR